jgi:hypothetical protein
MLWNEIFYIQSTTHNAYSCLIPTLINLNLNNLLIVENGEVNWLFGHPITRAIGYTACEYANKMNGSDTQQHIKVTEQYHFFPYHHSPRSGYNNIYHCKN